MIRSSMLALTLALSLGSLAGCSTHEAAAQPQAAKPVAATTNADDMKSLCVQMMTRARECTSDYIPALVDSRARHDQPPGIAAAVKQDRNAVIAEAMKEWETDSTDESIQAMCDKLEAQMTGEDQASVDLAKSCVARPECAAYTSCVMPVFEKHFAK